MTEPGDIAKDVPADSGAAAGKPAPEESAAQAAGVAATRGEPRRGLYLTPRQAFGAIAAVLALALVALLIYLLYSLQPHSLGVRGGAVVDGIKPLFTIEGPGTGKYPTFNRPLGVTFGSQGRVYVSDTGNNRVCVFDSSGNFVKEWGTFGVAKPAPGGVFSWVPGRFNFPDGIASDAQGDIYVADFRNDSIQVFDAGGTFLRRFPDPTKPVGMGSSGQDGRGIAVTSIAVVGDKVYATDTYQVFVFTLQGKLLEQFGKPGRGPGDLDHPNGVAASPGGTIYVSDSNHARVTAFTASGTPVWNVGRIPAGMNDTSPADLDLPRGLAVNPDGSIIVVDVFGFDLVKISAQGKVLARYGSRGVIPGEFNFPNDVSVLGTRLAVADKENNRVQVLQLVGQ